MSTEEVAAFLDEPHKLQLATINPDGTPHLVTMYYAMFDGRVGFWTYAKSQKARNLERDPRATCLIEAGSGYADLRGVQIVGRVVPMNETERIREIGEAVYRRYVGDWSPDLAGYVRQQSLKRRAYLLEPERTATWDHRKLGGSEGGGR
jgi:PPOX class probable F420-dependent enzyme